MLRRVGRASTCRPRCAAPRRSSGWGCRRRRTATPRAAAPPPLRAAPGSRGEGGQDAAWPAALPTEHHRLPRVVERGAWRKGAATQWMVPHGAEHPRSAISGPLTACPRRACIARRSPSAGIRWASIVSRCATGRSDAPCDVDHDRSRAHRAIRPRSSAIAVPHPPNSGPIKLHRVDAAADAADAGAARFLPAPAATCDRPAAYCVGDCDARPRKKSERSA